MRISLRTSGGRGEYELAGDQPPFTIDNVLEKRILVRMAPSLIFDSGNIPKRLAGKPRIRVEQGSNHVYQFFAAAYLLPTPKRELGATGNAPMVLKEMQYSIAHINFYIVDSSDNSITIAPTSIECRNTSDTPIIIDHAHRLAQVSMLWARFSALDCMIQHREAFESHDVTQIKTAWRAVLRFFELDTSPLGWSMVSCREDSTIDSVGLSPEHTVIQPIEARIREFSNYRLQAIRSNESRRFSGEVKTRYDFRCVFTGMRLPRPGNGAIPGVDAAHILPWNTYDVNVVNNGLCLSKTCHWAFDNGILRLDYNRTLSRYELSIPESTRHLATQIGLDLSHFSSLCGAIPQDRFPANIAHRPDPDLIDRLNSDLYG